jgi:hypothetical protein
MRLHLFSAALLALAACAPPPAEKTEPAPQSEAAAPAAPGAAVEFSAPSGNLGCVYIPSGGTAVYQPAQPGAELSCDRIEPSYVRITMPEHGPARVVETQERGCCSGTPIPNGDDWSDGPFVCEMSEAAVTCRSAEGHGFSLGRAQADVH